METVQGGVRPYGVKETLVVNGKIVQSVADAMMKLNFLISLTKDLVNILSHALPERGQIIS